VLRLFAVLAVLCIAGSTLGFARGDFAHGAGFASGGMGERHFGDKAGRRHYGLYRGWGAPYGSYGGDGYYGDDGYYDPPTVAPGEQPTYPTTALPTPESRTGLNCRTQTYKVPSERGGEASVTVVGNC
jgi:hypothetical protein